MEGYKAPDWGQEAESGYSHNKGEYPPRNNEMSRERKKEMFISRINSSSFPLTLNLSNLSYHLKEHMLRTELGISDKSTITLIKEDEKFMGAASVTLDSLTDALLLAEKYNTEVAGRILFVNFPYNKSNRGGEGRGDRGDRGDRGRRGGNRGNRGDRGERKGEYRGGRQIGGDAWRKPEREGGAEEAKGGFEYPNRREEKGRDEAKTSNVILALRGESQAQNAFLAKISTLATELGVKLEIRNH